ncbi:DUF1963 domain-containing protein [Rhizobium panacihumi]|uniref:DUF1963 domain-containing protein n=1 Tax=Rhizobium panacihumi TaxID=2008450 RepID=UPI003D7AEBA9
MAAFLNKEDICLALADQNLSQFEDRILATIKPAIDFVRRQMKDKDLPAGTSKMGGLPDLPVGFRWPTRPALSNEEDGAPTTTRDVYHQLREAARRKEFPLAFFAQLNLSILSLEAGFDLDLPDSGMLYIFEDITAYDEHEAYSVFQIEEDLAGMERHSPPEELVILSDAKDPTLPFFDQPMAEVLEPYSILTVPYHWLQSSAAFYSQMSDFLEMPKTDYRPPVTAVDGENASPFGDRLGGWPVPIQHDPEPKFRHDRSRSFRPGDDEIRLLFSWGGEYFAGTRLMHSDLSGDGAMHIMMHRDDMLARHFDKAKALYQYT